MTQRDMYYGLVKHFSNQQELNERIQGEYSADIQDWVQGTLCS